MLNLLDNKARQDYVCEHCGSKFTKEKTLIAESSVPPEVSFDWTFTDGEWIEPVIAEYIEAIPD